jgi:hypothetical protein
MVLRDTLYDEIDRRGLRLLDDRSAGTAAASAHLDAEAVLRIRSHRDRRAALESMGWTADANRAYEQALRQASPQLARLATVLQSFVLDTASDHREKLEDRPGRAQVLAEVRALRAASPGSVLTPEAAVRAAAEIFAREKLPDSESRASFLRMTRERMAKDVAAGRELPTVNVRLTGARSVAQPDADRER